MSQRFDRESGFKVAEFKATPDTTGEFTALVSVFGNVDLGGDRVVEGAFGKSLAKWRESGDPIPVIWNHQWDNPLAHIGKVDPEQAEETPDGLLVKGSLDLDNAFAAQVHRLLSERRVKELSFGYNVVDSERTKDGALNLIELDLIEVGPTLKGMNPETELLAVKAYKEAELEHLEETIESKAGARLSKDTRAALEQASAALSQANDAISSLLATDDSTEKSSEPATPDEAEASGKASDADADIHTLLNLLKEK
jgi:uncharacterized protein